MKATAEQHTPVYRNTTPYTCEVCGETVKTDEAPVKGEPEDHIFVDGVCNVCDYECEHTDADVSVGVGGQGVHQ